MARIASRKIHFAPLQSQERAIRSLLRRRRHRNITELLRRAIDVYLAELARPSPRQQAQWMAEDFRSARGRRREDVSRLQDTSRSAEDW